MYMVRIISFCYLVKLIIQWNVLLIKLTARVHNEQTYIYTLSGISIKYTHPICFDNALHNFNWCKPLSTQQVKEIIM